MREEIINAHLTV